jgi:glutathione S-transferase
MAIQASDLTLYQFTTCPFCLRVRHAIHKLGIDVTMKNTHKSDEARQELLAGGGRTTVPCLRIANGDGEATWMYESGDIVAFLHEHFGT